MGLFAYERRHLDRIEGDLRAEDRRLASMFDIFTRLGREDGRPLAEAQYRADGAWREVAYGRERARRRIAITATMLLTLLVAVVVLSLM
jgi:hypothetical protein